MELPLLLRNRIESTLRKYSTEDTVPLCDLQWCKNVIPIAQNGPQCGLVALRMAMDWINGSSKAVDDYLSLAQELHYSNNGEMFSAAWLADLANRSSGSIKATKKVGFPSIEQITESSRRQNCALLIPYDCDKNHEPCLASGHKAHWCLLVGFLSISSQQQISLRDHSDLISTAMSQQNAKANVDHFYVLAYHGKSKHAGVWQYSLLRDSNAQLIALGERRKSDALAYQLPAGGVEAGLCSQYVRIERVQ